jgi:hypothetical protein
MTEMVELADEGTVLQFTGVCLQEFLPLAAGFRHKAEVQAGRNERLLLG